MSTLNRGVLFAKMAAVMGEVHRIPKNGYNKFQRYNYATESDVADFIRPLLAKHGIGLVFGVDEVTQLENGRTLARITITIGDESGAEISTTVYGEARDVDSKGNPQDKGLYKAMTGAVKYWLFKTFLVSTGDDPEADVGNAPDTPPTPKAPHKETTLVAKELKMLLDTHPMPADGRKAALAAYAKLDLNRMKTAITYIKEQA